MKSNEIFETAKTLMPGGVSSPVRAIKPYPFYTESASGARLKTVDGKELDRLLHGVRPPDSRPLSP